MTLHLLQASSFKIQVAAFDYTDEDGDLTTVRSDTELHAMLHYHINTKPINHPTHLSIFPKIKDPSRDRNRFALKVNIKPSLSSLLLSTDVPPQYTEMQKTSGVFKPQRVRISQFIPDKNNDPTSNSNPAMYHQLTTNNHLQPTTSPSAKYNQNTLQLLETLGKGNSGFVRRAVHKPTGTVTAVKSIALDLTGEEQRRILLELEILQR